jgi:hypothetical protein
MIICSLPRCGATRFCLDLEEKYKLKFVGELNPYFIEELGLENTKAPTHETSFQPNYSVDMFASLLKDDSEHIVLVNDSPHLVVARADYIVLRRDMKQAFLSTANYLLKMFPNIKANVIVHMLDRFYYSYRGIEGYINKYPKEVVWYEDYYGLNKTQTPLLDSHIHSKVIIDRIEEMFGA